MRKRWYWLPVVAVAIVATAATLWLSSPPRDEGRGAQGGRALTQALGGGSLEDYDRVTGPRELTFPADHGPHPDYRNEWWYFTGNLSTDAGRRFGYQLTFFRIALAPGMPDRKSAWASRQVYMAHLTVTDVAAGSFHEAERFARAGLGLAGARAPDAERRFRVWLGPWSLEGRPPGTAFPARLQARGGEAALDLALRAVKPRVLHGERGYSRKGPGEGDASYYYSYTRLATEGEIEVGGRSYRVTGTSWLDREWSTSVLGEEQVGWDWFALQLDDGRELMYYRLRRADGAASRFAYAVLVGPDGRRRVLDAGAVKLEVLDRWRSPVSGIRYPSGWRLSVPGRGLVLTVRPWLRDQELNVSVTYWEGAVSVTGRGRDGPVEGVGYVELTGYGG